MAGEPSQSWQKVYWQRKQRAWPRDSHSGPEQIGQAGVVLVASGSVWEST
jgi:hypothetical protein